MKILYISPFNPLDKSCGGAIRSGALFRSLQKFGRVRTLVVSGRSRMCAGDEDALGIRFLSTDSFACSKLKWPLVILLSIFFRNPNWAFPRKDEIVKAVGGEDFNLVVVRYLWCVAKLGVWKFWPCYVDVDDSPIAQFNTTIAPTKNFFLRPIVKWFYVSWQYLIARLVCGLWVSNSDDIRVLSRLNRRIVYLPNVSQESQAFECTEDHGVPFLLSVGCMGFAPNYQGVDRFLKTEWNSILSVCPALKYKIVGRSLPDDYHEAWKKIPGVEIMGFVDDLKSLYACCLAVVVPIWSGGGTSVKTIEALKHGCKVFSTEKGARGLSVDQIRNARVCVVTEDGDFGQEISCWVNRSVDSRATERKAIYEIARDINSSESFSQAVNALIGAHGK